jgi:hypothetical protein
MAFRKLKIAVENQFKKMQAHALFRTTVSGDELWRIYLESFPPGSNLIMKERTEHDCRACRSFIRNAGSMVAVIDGDLVSLWDCDVGYPYDVVTRALAEAVKAAPIRNVFLHEQHVMGVDRNRALNTAGDVVTWEHLHVVLPPQCVNQDPGEAYSRHQSTRDLFHRALDEITVDAVETVLDLIGQGSLYRGEEHRHAVEAFKEERRVFMRLRDGLERDVFVWRQDVSPQVARIRNSVIGSLLTDLSKGMELDAAVRSFEVKVAPANYQRPKAVVTTGMVKKAQEAVAELGYAAALQRRFATVEDVAITDVLFADRSARKAMQADIFDDIAAGVRPDVKKLEKVEEVPIETFIGDVLPTVTALELLVENRHHGNFVNLVAPVDPSAKLLFKWDNGFSWAYNGDLADSIKERVKARGGSVTGDFRASLAWFNADDLDLHLKEPDGTVIYFGNRRSHTGGVLDVDMNVLLGGSNFARGAVENITYARRNQMKEGTYEIRVHNYTHRESEDVGFEVELEFDGELRTFSCAREVRPRETVMVATFTFSRKEGLKIVSSLPQQTASRVIWGLQTQMFHPVSLVMLSPNHWGGRQIGNKHWFFILRDCLRDGSSRGFFNEQLRDELREHRKVFELVGAKVRTQETGDQLSGLGFSSTQRSSVMARVTGSFDRVIKITF